MKESAYKEKCRAEMANVLIARGLDPLAAATAVEYFMEMLTVLEYELREAAERSE